MPDGVAHPHARGPSRVAGVHDGGVDAEPERAVGQGVGEHADELGAVEYERLVAEPGAGGGRVRADEPAPVGPAQPDLALEPGEVAQPVAEAERAERADGVGGDGDPGPDGFERARAFQDGDLPPGAGERDAGREPADPAADDDGPRAHHSISPQRITVVTLPV